MKTLKEIRREYILTVLENNGWDLGKASAILKISKDKLRREMHLLGQSMEVVTAKPPAREQPKKPHR